MSAPRAHTRADRDCISTLVLAERAASAAAWKACTCSIESAANATWTGAPTPYSVEIAKSIFSALPISISLGSTSLRLV